MSDESRSKDPENDGHSFSLRTTDTVSNGLLMLRCDECDHMWDMDTFADRPMVIESDCKLCLGKRASLRIKRGVWVKLYGGAIKP